MLFRVGDFYETFGQDAIKASGILGIVLAKRKNGSAAHIELAGFPHHSLDVYLPKGVSPLVAIGQTAVAGETILADLADPSRKRTGIPE